MHDTTFFETQGIPSVFILSTEFVSAANAQSEALGLPELRRVFVEHPLQDATDEEMRAKADSCFDAVIDALVD